MKYGENTLVEIPLRRTSWLKLWWICFWSYKGLSYYTFFKICHIFVAATAKIIFITRNSLLQRFCSTVLFEDYINCRPASASDSSILECVHYTNFVIIIIIIIIIIIGWFIFQTIQSVDNLPVTARPLVKLLVGCVVWYHSDQCPWFSHSYSISMQVTNSQCLCSQSNINWLQPTAVMLWSWKGNCRPDRNCSLLLGI